MVQDYVKHEGEARKLSRGVFSDIWRRALSVLQARLKERDFNSCIMPLQASGAADTPVLYAPNAYVQERVKDVLLQQIQEIVSACYAGKLAGIRVLVGVADQAHNQVREEAPGVWGNNEAVALAPVAAKKVLFASDTIDPAYTFDNFLVGDCNDVAHAAAKGVAKENLANKSRLSYNPMLMYGNSGVGKTHLMCAMGNHVMRHKPSAQVMYLTAHSFVQKMVAAIQAGSINRFISYYSAAEVLCLDDLQFFAEKLKSQEEVFNIFNTVVTNGCQVILTCDRYPRDIKGLEERLISRFLSGLTVTLEKPELEHRAAILVHKAKTEGVCMPEPVALFIAERMKTNVRELEGALKQVKAYSQFRGGSREITVALVRHALSDTLASHQAQRVTIEDIQRTVAEYFKIKKSDLSSPKRSRGIARPRQMAMSLAKELTRSSLPEIGEDFGGRDHTTVLHACRKVKELLAENADFAEDYRNVKHLLVD